MRVHGAVEGMNRMAKLAMKSSTGCGHTDLTNSLYIIALETYPSTAVPTDLLQDRFLEVGSNFCSFECPTR